MTPSRTHLAALLAPLVLGCGTSVPNAPQDASSALVDTPAAITDTPTAITDAGPALQDSPAPTDVPAVATDTGATIPRLNDCMPTDYVDRVGADDARTIVPRGSTGYTPRCVTIRAGQMVTFSMDFTVHPLIAGVPHGSSVGATTPSPIETQRSGNSYVVTFANAGNYPFYCTVHGHVGMAGVVRVIP